MNDNHDEKIKQQVTTGSTSEDEFLDIHSILLQEHDSTQDGCGSGEYIQLDDQAENTSNRMQQKLKNKNNEDDLTNLNVTVGNDHDSFMSLLSVSSRGCERNVGHGISRSQLTSTHNKSDFGEFQYVDILNEETTNSNFSDSSPLTHSPFATSGQKFEDTTIFSAMPAQNEFEATNFRLISTGRTTSQSTYTEIDTKLEKSVKITSAREQTHRNKTTATFNNVQQSLKFSSSISEVLHSNQILNNTDQELSISENDRDQEAWLMYLIFEDFCSPSISRATCSSILEMEKEQRYTTNVNIPDQPVILQLPVIASLDVKSPPPFEQQPSCPVISLLQPGLNTRSTPVILQLPVYFSASFLRILIRLLSHETDVEYNQSCLLTLPWKESLYGKLSLSKDPYHDPDHPTRRPHLQYSVARFQCTWESCQMKESVTSQHREERPALVGLLNLWERVATAPTQFERLIAPLSRLIGLLSVAGVNPTILRRIMNLISQNQSTTPQLPPNPHLPNHSNWQEQIRGYSVYARLCLMRALSTAAAGASRSSLLPKSTPTHYFSFGRGMNNVCTGMERTINGVSVWPFRNDFGMAGWFRSEHFVSARKSSESSSLKPIILFSVRTDEGGGIEISLVPIDDEVNSMSSPVRTIAVSIYDSDYSNEREITDHKPAHFIKARGGCVLLPQVWYHVAVRHTRSRLKGVFSLSTRQQLTIILDGKTMLNEPLNFPIILDRDTSDDTSATSLLKNSFRRNFQSNALNITMKFGQNFEGQTGALYVFNDNVSDATFRSLYEYTGGLSGVLMRGQSLGDSWDRRHSEMVRRSRVLDVNISNEDVNQIVLSHGRSVRVGRKALVEKVLSVLDFGEGDEQDDSDVPVELQRAAFGSKIFISWNPRRILGSLAIELHVGAHVSMLDVHPWRLNSVQDVIGSLGGIQTLVPVFRSFLAGEIERNWAASCIVDLADTPISLRSSDPICTIMSDLIKLLTSFVLDNEENLKELLRCGGIDVVEQLIHSSRKLAVGRGSRSSVFGAMNSHPGLASLLLESLLSLRFACSHYVGLETKVFSRLLFNIPLWLGNFQQIPGIGLHVTLLPLLSSLTKLNPEKVRDCVGTIDMVHLLQEYNADFDGQQAYSDRFALDRFTKNDLEELSAERSLSNIERRHATYLLLAMIFNVLAKGTTPADLSPVLNLISHNLESEWEQFLLRGEKSNFSSAGPQTRIVTYACTVLHFLLQIRPCVSGLFESLAHCCGGAQNVAGWILCSLVNAHNDEIRGLGIRCLASYLDVVSRGADSPLSLGTSLYPSPPPAQMPQPSVDMSSMVRRSSSRFSQIAKGLASMSPAGVRSVVIPPSRLTARVCYKLLWHLLKGRGLYLGEKTRTALLSWIVIDDGLSVLNDPSSLSYIQTNLIVPFQAGQNGFLFCMEWAFQVLAETTIVSPGRSLRNPLAISTILRLLRFLENDLKDQWLTDILHVARSNRKCLALLAALPDWQPCLFPLVSETLESVNSHRVEQNIYDGTTFSLSKETIASSRDSLFNRLDRCLALYSMLLGHLVREGGDQSLEAVEKATALERTCVNGHDVLLLILSGLCSNIFEFGSLLDMGSFSAQDWKGVDLERDSPLLRQSARLVTDAILSNGTKGLDMPSAVRSWRGLRHLTEVVTAVVTKCGFGVVDLFDYVYQQASSVDRISGGFHGIRLPVAKLLGVNASEYAAYIHSTRSIGHATTYTSDANKREVDRRLCVRLAAHVLSLLDAFIFPQSEDDELPMSQMHSIALVRNSEVRLGTSQGPLISSAIRLSFLLLALVEPCSVIFLQSASRLRCLLCWALDLIRESSSIEGGVPPFHKDGITHIDRLILCILLHCHRTLGRCASLLSEIESSSFEKYFPTREAHKKYYRRLMRVALELREVVSTAYRGRNEFLRSTLSDNAFEALRVALEGNPTITSPSSKESVIREFLTSAWVSGFQDCETRAGLIVPEQVMMHSVPLSSNQDNQPGLQGFVAIEKVALESASIVSEFEKTIDSCFKVYLDEHQRWAETSAVRDLEYEGDTTIKRFSEKYKVESTESAKIFLLRKSGAENRWRTIQRSAVDPWKNASHWKLARYTDFLGRRTILVPNHNFRDHLEASYDLTVGRELDQAGSQAINVNLLEKNTLSEVMRRNAEAFVVTSKDETSINDDDSTSPTSDSESTNTDAESSADASGDASVDMESVGDAGEKNQSNVVFKSIADDVENDEGWDKIDKEEINGLDPLGDVDAWAKTFIWSDAEIPVSRFEHVMIVSLQTVVEGKALLTTHCLYFHQIGDEINLMTKQPADTNDTTVAEGRYRRWRLTRLIEVHGRRYMLRSQGLELFFSDTHELLLNFPGGMKERDRFYTKLRSSCKVPMLRSTRSLNPRVAFKKSKYTELWRKRKISNFEYLMALNRMAGRSFNDLTQYPVFPWVIADFTSDTIDLTDSRVFRDLTKPIGALNPDRLSILLERYNELELFGFSDAEKFLYGSHYSSPGIVLHYLIRQEPFTSMAIDLQSGRFDCPDRLFISVSESWNSCLTSSSDMKELIPEFFSLPEMFLNTNKFPLGMTQSGIAVDNVELPPWAKGSAFEFVRINRLALESEYVSKNLNSWIDLVFGYKQRGQEAVKAHNVFHHLSYEGSVDLDKIVDEIDRTAAETHIQNFGQTPSQLLDDEPHTFRSAAEECWKPLLKDPASSRSLSCYTASKQFSNMRLDDAKGACVKLHVFSDTIVAIYEDFSVGTYKWYPTHKTNRLRMDKLKPVSRRDISTSRFSMKRGSSLSVDILGKSNLAIKGSSFGVTLGGLIKEELRRKAVMPSGRLITATEMSLTTAEASALIISCGYWDECVKAHCVDGWRMVASETGGHIGPIRCLSIANDGGFMVTGGQDGTCRVWVVDHPDMVVALSDGVMPTVQGGSNVGEQLLSCCHTLLGHDSPISCVAVDSDLDVVVSGDLAGLLCVHKLRRGEFVRSFRPPALSSKIPAGGVSKIVISCNGFVVAQMEDLGLHSFSVNAVRLCKADAGELLHDMVISSTGEMLVTGGERGHVVVRNIVDFQVCSILDLSRYGPICSLALTPADLNPIAQYLFVGSSDGTITVVESDPMNDPQDNQTVTF